MADERVTASTCEEQCTATTRNGSDGVLFCRFVAGHPGKHQTNYIGGTEWGESFNCAPPSLEGYAVRVRCSTCQTPVFTIDASGQSTPVGADVCHIVSNWFCSTACAMRRKGDKT